MTTFSTLSFYKDFYLARLCDLSSDGNTLAVGAPECDKNGVDASGHVRIFQRTESTSTWTQMGTDIDGEASGDWFDYSVPMSSDGKTVTVGAPENDGNGVGSGHARIFQLSYEWGAYS